MISKALINWGGYDVDNFGDLLYPIIIDHFLGSYFSRIYHASPTGNIPKWKDSIPTCRIGDCLMGGDPRVLMVGGGNLLSFNKATAREYSFDEEFARIVYPSFLFVPYILYIMHHIPYAYHLVGVRQIPSGQTRIVRTLIENATFVSCRDISSRSQLIDCGIEREIGIGIDSAYYISEIFKEAELRRVYHQQSREKFHIPAQKQTAVVHLKRRYVRDHFDHAVKFLRRLISYGNVQPVLIPFGPCHGDDDLLVDLPEDIRNFATIVHRPEMIVDVIATIANSCCYVGSSLHGGIVALSYNRPIAFVADEEMHGIGKFSGFLSQLKIEPCLYRNWKEALTVFERSRFDMFKGSKSAFLGQSASVYWKEVYRRLSIQLSRKRIMGNPLLMAGSLCHAIAKTYGIA
jgi:hypothetical protein